MMNGYDKQEALTFIVKRIHEKDHPELAGMIETLISQAIDADMEYMHKSGVLDNEGNAGDEYYEDDDAFEYMVEAIVAKNKLTPEQAVKVAALVDDYMDHQQAYLESRGLVDWE
ncbi:MAG: hypothetical protein IJ438_08570 [Clostridia bacterium]|nr:hypothetical protein [Clostridia bacterium]